MHRNAHRDIYKARSAAEPPSPPPPPSAGGNRALLRTLVSTALGLFAMLALLGAATWLILKQERESEKPEHAIDPDELPPPPTPVLSGRGAPVEIAMPDETAALLQGAAAGLERARQPRLDAEQIGRIVDLLRSAQEHASAREWEAAEERARQALAIGPDNAMAQRLLGMVFIQQGRFDQALEVLRQAQAADPFRAEIHANLAAAYMHKGQFDLAEDALHTALRIDPEYTVALLNLGLLYVATERYAWAAEQLSKALQRQPENEAARNNLGVALIRLGRTEQARGQFMALLNQNPRITLAYFNVAITYALERNEAAALEWIRKGAEQCSPLALNQFLSDPDFNTLRNHPDFQRIVSEQAQGRFLPPPGMPRDGGIGR